MRQQHGKIVGMGTVGTGLLNRAGGTRGCQRLHVSVDVREAIQGRDGDRQQLAGSINCHRSKMHPKMFIIPTIAITGFVCPLMIRGIALGQEKALAGSWYVVPRDMDDSRLSLGIKDMPADHASCLNRYNMVDRLEVAKMTPDGWFLKII